MRKQIIAILGAGLLAVVPCHAETVKAAGTVTVLFSPDGGAERAIVNEIRAAKLRVLVQAYSFTSAPIYEALAAAKGRGVDVRVLVDKDARQPDFRGMGARYVMQRGVPLAVDEVPGRGIAHNKVMVIDAGTVITGSFNFSRQAETTNAENLVIFHEAPDLVRLYTENWARRQQKAKPY